MQIKDYIGLLKKITEESPDERVYQTRLLQPLFDEVYSTYQVVDVSWTTNTKVHTKEYYTFPVGERGVLDGTSPDIIIASNYKHANQTNQGEPKIAIAVEVKAPYPISKEMNGSDINNWNMHPIDEVLRYLQAVDRVIITNCSSWYFFDLNENSKHEQLRSPKVKDYLRSIASLDWYKTINEKKRNAYEDALRKLTAYVEEYYQHDPQLLCGEKDLDWYHNAIGTIQKDIKALLKECKVKQIALLDKSADRYCFPDLGIDDQAEEYMKQLQQLLEKINIPEEEWKELLDYLMSFLNADKQSPTSKAWKRRWG